MKNKKIKLKKDEYMCCLYETPRTFDWCERYCERYYSCDTVAWANDKYNEDELSQGGELNVYGEES